MSFASTNVVFYYTSLKLSGGHSPTGCHSSLTWHYNNHNMLAFSSWGMPRGLFCHHPIVRNEPGPLATPHTVFKLPAEESDCLLRTDVGAPLASVFLIDMANGCIWAVPWNIILWWVFYYHKRYLIQCVYIPGLFSSFFYYHWNYFNLAQQGPLHFPDFWESL